MKTERIGDRYFITLDNGVMVSSSDYGKALDLAMAATRRSAAIEFRQRQLTKTIIERVRIGNDDLGEVEYCQNRLEMALQS
jgi:hypothetical protein